jgi:hypothetical protein
MTDDTDAATHSLTVSVTGGEDDTMISVSGGSGTETRVTKYWVFNLKTGTYHVKASCQGYSPATETIGLAADYTCYLTLRPGG